MADRSNKVAVEGFGRPHVAGSGLDAFLKSLPAFLAVEAVRHGASIVRVHNVPATRQALAVFEAMR